MPKRFTVLTPNRYFTGVRNAGKYSTTFKDGQAEVDEKTAHILVKNFGYFCPELYPDHKTEFDNGEGTEPRRVEKASIDGVKIRFVYTHKIGKNHFSPGDVREFKPKYAQKLIDKGKAELVVENDSHQLPDAANEGAD